LIRTRPITINTGWTYMEYKCSKFKSYFFT